MRNLTPAQSKKRIAALRRQGYHVQTVTLPNGDVAVLKHKPKKAHEEQAAENPPKPVWPWVIAGIGALVAGVGVVLYLKKRNEVSGSLDAGSKASPSGGGVVVAPPPKVMKQEVQQDATPEMTDADRAAQNAPPPPQINQGALNQNLKQLLQVASQIQNQISQV